MANFASKTWDILRLLSRGGPALCNVAVTNACNAACDFCNFARGKVGSSNLRWIDAGQFGRALDICSVWNFGDAPPIRDGCTACVADCYRDSSVMLHFAVSLGDTLNHLRNGRVLAASKTLTDRRNFISLGAVLQNAHVLTRLVRLG